MSGRSASRLPPGVAGGRTPPPFPPGRPRAEKNTAPPPLPPVSAPPPAHEALAEQAGQSVGDEPARDVCGSPRGRGNDEAHGTLRIRLGGGVARYAEEQEDPRGCRTEEAPMDHAAYDSL